ncbi:UNVERIFIED_CONTAM: hypothetical protein K2H54_033224 [Gekko kuhli]
MIDVEATLKHDHSVMMPSSETPLGSDDDLVTYLNPEAKVKINVGVREIVSAVATIDIKKIQSEEDIIHS